jgi:hypothetical protein
MSGKWKGKVKNSEGKDQMITLTEVQYAPELWVNLFSLTAAMKQGCEIAGKDKHIKIKKGKWEISFDQQLGSPNGFICGIKMTPLSIAQYATVAVRQMNYAKMHQILGHPGSEKLNATAARMHWHLGTKENSECKDCMIGKARRKDIPKDAEKSIIPGERLMIDISSVKTKDKKKIGKFWLLVVDEATLMKWSFFLPTKDSQVQVLMDLIREINSNPNKKVKFIRCNNAGENINFEKEAKKEGLGLTFEYPARNTPQ